VALYYEDLAVGDRFTTASRTVTETDLVSFAMLSGDWNQIHTDVEFARETAYGQRVVHGLFGLSLLTGLMDRTGIFSGSAIAMLGIREWRFTGPIFVGDTVHGVIEIASMRMTSKGDRGIVDRRLSLVNQRDEVVQEGHIATMLRLRPQPAQTT
jgi:acyl dehydratase